MTSIKYLIICHRQVLCQHDSSCDHVVFAGR